MTRKRKGNEPSGATPPNPRIEILCTYDPVWIVLAEGGSIRGVRVRDGACLCIGRVNATGMKAEVHGSPQGASIKCPFVLKSDPWYRRLFTNIPWDAIDRILFDVRWEMKRA